MPAESSSRRSSGTSRHALVQPPRSGGVQLISVNSTRIAWILSILLSFTLCLQIMLLFNHDDFETQMSIMENKLMEEIAYVEDIASDAFNAAQHREDEEEEESGAFKPGQRLVFDVEKMHDASWDESTTEQYSMEPEDILRRAGVDPSEGYMPQLSFRESRANERRGITVQKKMVVLPTLEEIQSMYGSKAHILGLERCEAFRNSVPEIDRLMGPAGLFNSATNLLATLLKMNCVNSKRFQSKEKRYMNSFRTGILPQAPWGKHNPVTWRNIHSAKFAKKLLHQTDFLPIVIIKDPITWFASMCRHGYEARWWRTPQHCPNLVPNKYDKRGGYKKIGQGEIAARVKFATPYIGKQPMPDSKNKTFVNYTSMIDLWNTWYSDWHDVEFPRLMIRFEDLLFHAEETITKVCECGGGKMQKKFHYMEDSAKGSTGVHSGSAGFLASLVNYGNITLRMKDIMKWEKDADYFNEHVDKELMELFSYAYLDV